jgi:hypothetical protein
MNEITKRIRICHDQYYEWDDMDTVHIAYLKKSRYCLGTEAVTEERMAEIQEGIDNGSLIGCTVYAYVHSGSTIAVTPFSCPWDSGRSGFVYMDRKDAVGWAGRSKKTKKSTHKVLTKKDADMALRACEGIVRSFAQYLEGDIWGFIAEDRVTKTWTRPDGTPGEEDDWEEVDSCWGFFGDDPEKNGIKEHVLGLLEEGYVFTNEKGEPL